MPISDFDPRVYFAAERTLLAWLRTGLTVMAFGFVIARFGLFLQIVAIQAPAVSHPAQTGLSAILGIVLVAAGTLMIIVAAIEHRRFIATLPPADRPQYYAGGALIMYSSILLAVVGIALTAYLTVSAG